MHWQWDEKKKIIKTGSVECLSWGFMLSDFCNTSLFILNNVHVPNLLYERSILTANSSFYSRISLNGLSHRADVTKKCARQNISFLPINPMDWLQAERRGEHVSLSCLSLLEHLLTSMNAIHWANNLRGIYAVSPQFLPNQMMCASCHMNTVCKHCEGKRDRDREGERKRERERETTDPRALLLLTSLFSQTVCR